MPRTLNPGETILNRDAFKPYKLAWYGCDNLSAFADRVGVHRTTLSRAYTGTSSPGMKLVNALMRHTKRPYTEFVIRVSEETTIPVPGDPDYDPGDWGQFRVRDAA